MKQEVYNALKEFEQKLNKIFPDANFRLAEPFEGNDVVIEVVLPVNAVTWDQRVKLSEITSDLEEKYGIYICALTRKIA